MQTTRFIQETLMEMRLRIGEFRREGQNDQTEALIVNIADNTERLLETVRSFEILNPGLFTTTQPLNTVTGFTAIAHSTQDRRPDGEERDIDDRIERDISENEHPEAAVRIASPRRRQWRTRVRFTEEESELILRLKSERVSWPAIARRIGKTPDQVRYHWRWKAQRRPAIRHRSHENANVVAVATPERPRSTRI
jgi:hypothetical protein